MKKLLFLLIVLISALILFPKLAWGQGGEPVVSQTDIDNSTAIKADTTTQAWSGTITTVALKVGSSSKVQIDSVVKSGTDVKFYNGSTQLNAVDNDTVSLASAVLSLDTVNTRALDVDSIEIKKLRMSGARNYGPVIQVENTGTTTEATAIKGTSYATTSNSCIFYGIQGHATGTAGNSTNIGIYGYATGGGTNIGGAFRGDIGLYGSSSGMTTLRPPAAAGSAVITFPAVTGTLTLVLSGAADTTGIAPPVIGAIYVDTSGHKVYISQSTARGGWLILNYFLMICVIRRKNEK